MELLRGFLNRQCGYINKAHKTFNILKIVLELEMQASLD